MPTSYPTSLGTADSPAATDLLNTGTGLRGTAGHHGEHDDVNLEVLALEVKVGINGSADTTSIDYKLAHQSTPAAVSTSGSIGTAGAPLALHDHVHAHEAAHINHDTTWAAKGDLIVATANDTAAVLGIGATGAYLRVVLGTAAWVAVSAATPTAVSTSGSVGTNTNPPSADDHVHAHEAAHVAHDTVWDAAGDLVIGSGADTAAKLGITVPAANILNVLGVVNGETTWSVKSIHDSTAPTTQAFGDAASAGTALTASHRDHKHAMPAAAVTSSGLTMTTARLLGRTTAATGAIEEITVGSGLSLSAGTLTGTGIATDTQVFTSSGTWTKPSGATFVKIICIAGGGGGGGGGKFTSATDSSGGGGGAGGGYAMVEMPASVLAATETVTVGTGGPGGAAQATGGTPGNVGTAGGDSSVTVNGSSTQAVKAFGGAFGNGGGSSGTALGGAAGAISSFWGGSGGAGGNGQVATAGTVGTSAPSMGGATPTIGGGGGGGGGGRTTGGGGRGGGTGGAMWNLAGGTAGAAGGSGSAPTTSAATNEPIPGPGGGGGASTSAAAGAGGNGGIYGGGGGGGGGGTNTVCDGGKGGDGANGIVIIISY